MEPKRIGLFDRAEQRLEWADRRQAVLARNIANANTPGYKPHDLQPFAAAVHNIAGVALAQTHANHIAASPGVIAPNEVVDRAHLQSPDGNAVALDEQLVKLADTETTHRLVTTIYRTYLGMFNAALGRGSSG
jgi:flagellar basal-body rod protein FlgB